MEKEPSTSSNTTTSTLTTVMDTSSNSGCATSVAEVPEIPLEPEVGAADGLDSPGTPNSDMDYLLTQQSPVIRKMTKPLTKNIVLSDSDDESMFSQPLLSSSSSNKGSKRKVGRKIVISDDEDEDDMWSSDFIKEKPKQRNSQTEVMPLRRSSRKRSKNSGHDSN